MRIARVYAQYARAYVRTPRACSQAYTRAYACIRIRYFTVETVTVLHYSSKKFFFVKVDSDKRKGAKIRLEQVRSSPIIFFLVRPSYSFLFVGTLTIKMTAHLYLFIYAQW